MLSMKNFLFLLLSPISFDIKKSEQIESCISYPYQNNYNQGIIQGCLPNGLQFKTSVAKNEGILQNKEKNGR